MDLTPSKESPSHVNAIPSVSFNADDIQRLLSESKSEIDKITKEFSDTSHHMDEIRKRKNELLSSSGCSVPSGGNNGMPVDRLAELQRDGLEQSLRLMNASLAKTQDVLDRLSNVLASSDLQDPDLIEAVAKFIESTHQMMIDHIELFKTKMAFLHDFDMENLKQQHRIEMEVLKNHLKKDIMSAKNTIDAESQDGQETEADTDSVAWSQDAVMRLMQGVDERGISVKHDK